MKKEFEIRIKADTNDGDYVQEISTISEEFLNKLRPMFEQIKNFKPYKSMASQDCGIEFTHYHNFPTGECLREDLGEKSILELYGWTEEQKDLLYEFLPSSEYGIHTIVSVTVCEVPSLEILI